MALNYLDTTCPSVDRAFFDFHLRKPLLPSLTSFARELGVDPPTHQDPEEILLTSLVPCYERVDDPARFIGDFFSVSLSAKTSMGQSCLTAMPTELVLHHCDIVSRTFTEEVGLEYKNLLLKFLVSLDEPSEIKSLHFMSLTLQSLVVWRNVKNYHAKEEYLKIPYWRKPRHIEICKAPDGSQLLRATIKSTGGDVRTLIVGHHLTLLLSTQDKAYTILTHDQLLMLQDTLTSRWLTLKTFHWAGDKHIPDCPSVAEVLRIYRAGDAMLTHLGNEAYNLIKFVEPLAIGLLQKSLDEGLGDNRGSVFLMQTVSDFYETAEKTWLPNLAEEFYNSLREINKVYSLVQIYGLFRHWGHPVISPSTGLRKLHNRGNAPIWVDCDFVQSLADDLAKQLLLSYFKQHQSWPPEASVKPSISPILHQCLHENRLPTLKEHRLIGEKWRHVSYSRIFDLPAKIPIGMILEDKAHSRDLTELISTLKSKKRTPISKRLLITVLEQPDIDIRKKLDDIDINGLTQEELVIGLKAKERELKTEGRFFALMTLSLRIYFVATEWLIARYILPVFPEITMGDSFISLQKKIFNITKTQTRSERSCVNFVVSLDYEKWNAHQRSESTRAVFEVIDRSFGWTAVVARTHEFFQKSIFYYADYKELVQKDLQEEIPLVWHGHLGGMEGLRQKGWTTVGILLLRRVMKRHTVQMKVLAQGDNQVFSLLYKTNIQANTTQYAQEVRKLRQKTEQILSEVVTLSNQLGLPVKKDETWISRSIFLYGKIPVIEGALRASVIKIISRMYTVTNDAAPTLQNTLSSLLTSCLTLTQQTVSPILGIVLYHWYGWELLSLGMDLNVLLGDSLYQVLNRKSCKMNNVSLGDKWRPTGDNSQTSMALDLFYRDSILGGMGGSNLYRWLTRQFPDPLTEALSFAKLALLPSNRKPVHDMGLRFLNPLMEYNASNFIRLIQDPTAIPIQGSTKSVNIIKDTVHQYLDQATWVQNRVIQESLQIQKLETDQLQLSMREITPCFPRFLSELWSATIVGRGAYYLGKLTSTTSLVAMSRTKGRMNLREKIKRAELSLCKTWLRQVITRHDMIEPECVSSLAQSLREEGWGLPIVGATLPHPATQWQLKPATKGSCVLCTNENLYLREHISIYVDPDLTRNPASLSKPGCFVPYLGSMTSEDPSTSPYGVLTTDEPLLKNAVHLLRTINWIIEPHSDMHASILNLLSSLTNAFDSGFPVCEQTRSGSGCHRFQSERVSGGAFPGIGFTGLSHFCFNSNNLTVLGRGEENFAILFQGVISHFMSWLATLSSCGKHLNVAYHLHPRCLDCLIPISELWLRTTKPLTFPRFINSNEFFLNAEDLDIYELPRMALTKSEFTEDDPENQALSCAVAILLSVISQAKSSGEILDASDVINLSYFKAISPEVFNRGLLCTFLMLEIMVLARRGRLWKTNKQQLMAMITQGAMSSINQPGTFSKLTMIFLIPHYWQYCISNALLSGANFPLKHQDGENTIRNWAYSAFEDESAVWEAICLISTRNFWVFYDLNTFKTVSCYYIASEVCAALVTDMTIPEDLRLDLQQLDRGYPPKVKFGTPPIKVSLATGKRVTIKYTSLTLKSAVKHIPTCATITPRYQPKPWKCHGTANPHVIWDSIAALEREVPSEAASKDFCYKSIGIHAVRLVCRLTTTHMKIAPILSHIRPLEGVMYSIGDGSGGIAAYLLGHYRTSLVIFNTLIDHQDEILQSTGTVIPPAVYLLPESDRGRLLNARDCSTGHTDLTDPNTFIQLAAYSETAPDKVTLIICDAEPREDKDFWEIYSNICSFSRKISLSHDAWVILKLHLSRDVSWEILEDSEKHWARIKIMRSDYSRYGSSEVYACLEGWGFGLNRGFIASAKSCILSELQKYNPESEYNFLSSTKSPVMWGNAGPEDKARTQRLMSKASAFAGLHIPHLNNLKPLPLEALNYLLTVYWEASRVVQVADGELIAQAALERRVPVIIGLEMGFSLLLRCQDRFRELALTNWGNVPAGLSARYGHHLISLRPRKPIWRLDCTATRHLGSDSLRSFTSWISSSGKNYILLFAVFQSLCNESQIYKFLLHLSTGNRELLIDEWNFIHFKTLILPEVADTLKQESLARLPPPGVGNPLSSVADND